MPNVDFAIQYAQKGIPVIPLHNIEGGSCTCQQGHKCQNNPGKHPRTIYGAKDATKDIGIIKSWWSRWPNANIGLLVGPKSGLSVLDVDPRNGGDESFRMMIMTHGDLPETVKQITGGRGEQYFFKYSERFGVPKEFQAGIDSKTSDNAYVLAPPSNHASGGHYEWVVGQSIFEKDLSEAPVWLTSSNGTSSQSVSEAYQGATKGNRHNAAVKVAGSLIHDCASWEEFQRAMYAYNVRLSPPLPEKEVETIARSIWKKEENNRTAPEQMYAKVPLPTGSLNDTWAAKLFFRDNGHNVRYCEKLGGWFIWDGKRWEYDEKNYVVTLARKTVGNLAEYAGTLPDNDYGNNLRKFSKQLGNMHNINAFVSMVRSFPGVSVSSDDFDNNNYKINCQNGVLDLGDDTFVAHNPDHNITRLIRAKYDTEAKCQRWLEFLDIIFLGNKQLIEYIQRVVGYCLTGDVNMQLFMILYGTGANGKSTFVETISHMLGGYAATASVEAFAARKNMTAPDEIARLKGVRFISASEPGSSIYLDEGLIKKITSPEPMTGRFLYAPTFQFVPTGKVFLSTNHKPSIRGQDYGLWRRIRFIPFEHVFRDKIDDFAHRFLYPEIDGIFQWAVEGYRNLREYGGEPPEFVRLATSEYMHSEDSIGELLDSLCVFNPAARVRMMDLRERIIQASHGKIKAKELREYLLRNGYKHDKYTLGGYGHAYEVWYGIGLRSESEIAECPI